MTSSDDLLKVWTSEIYETKSKLAVSRCFLNIGCFPISTRPPKNIINQEYSCVNIRKAFKSQICWIYELYYCLLSKYSNKRLWCSSGCNLSHWLWFFISYFYHSCVCKVKRCKTRVDWANFVIWIRREWLRCKTHLGASTIVWVSFPYLGCGSR